MDAGPGDVGGDAGRSEAPVVDAGPPPLPKGSPVTFHGNDSPLVFRVGTAERTKEERAKRATELLTRALDGAGELDEPPLPSVVSERGVGAVRVGKSLIATVYPRDADAEQMEFDRYIEHLDSQMKAWVPAQLRRRAVQLFALHVFLSIFFGVLGFLTLRFLRNAFDRWEEEFEERRGSLPAVSILRIPIFSSEAVGGAIAFGLAVGRVLAYVGIVISTLAAILSQFDFTRPLLRRLVSWSGGPLLNGLELVVTSIPGLVVAAILIVALQAALRVFNLLLDGVSKKRIVWKPLPPQKVPVFRFAVTAAVLLVVLPLLIAAAFGRFGTPLEFLALAAGAVVLISAIPMIASYVVGIRLLWREDIHAGDWVQVGDVAGEVTSCGLSEISLVPEGGGTIVIPMLFLVLHPLRRLRESPAVSFELTVARDRPVEELLKAIEQAVKGAEKDARVELVDVCHAWIKVDVSAPAVRTGVRQTLLIAVTNAVDNHLFELPTVHGPNRY